MSGIDWPSGWERTPAGDRERNRSFEATLGQTTQELTDEMDRLGADNWRASTASGGRYVKDRGLPKADANPDDPGFVLRWTDDEEQFAVACDAYSRLRDNVRTVFLWVHETRMRSQRPVQTGDAAFAAARLPPADEDAIAMGGDVEREAPHEVLDVEPDAPDAVVRGAARALKAETHPDSGGSDEEFKRIVEAEEAMLDG